jgi:hypothetical protein
VVGGFGLLPHANAATTRTTDKRMA